MKVGEFNRLIDELEEKILLEKSVDEVIRLVTRIKELAKMYDEEHDVPSEMIGSVQEIIHQFWSWSAHHLSFEQWHNDALVIPWLTFQKQLFKAGLLERDFHHSLLFQELKNRYDSVSDNQLKSTELLSLLTCASRMSGYARLDELDNSYPLLRLNECFSAKRSQETQKLKDILFLLQSSFYLLYKHCTVAQLHLIPYLIYFRQNTTDEERRSELAMFKTLTEKATDCLNFFHMQKDYIDTRSLKMVDALSQVAHLIPNRRGDFLQITNHCRWIYPFIQKSRIDLIMNDDVLLDETLRLLELDFDTQKDKSYPAALDFTAAAQKQIRTLTSREAKLVHTAITLFSLDKYIKQRQEDIRPKHSFLSLSRATKCQAAEKWKNSIRGMPLSIGFFEKMALNQGRLKQLIESLDEQERELKVSSDFK
ncbi:hypothetical protein Lsai_2092 [Legionella sainthelensi]|uniref:Uncharacterized protein n=1 Tax=Legionella sainthelensi TaxID=28087 RepID=A0A0W0YG72_9GAMM|nr:hypothetical protein [Legionella sainthelensi]KTD55962.1 hypothetical protein Lsai_2092 [Legionella sainthelensi]VEH29033.1 Uncharacterised protein [Legionella sainthelensi]